MRRSAAILMRKYQIPDYQADVCVAFAQGNVGKAIQLASSEEFNEMKASALQLIKRLSMILISMRDDQRR